MMREHVQSLLTLSSTTARRTWFAEKYPHTDRELVQALREHSYQLERENPHKALVVSAILHEAAHFWADPQVEAMGLLVEANARRLLGEHREAMQLYAGAIELFEQMALPIEAARAAMARLDSLIYLGCYDQAIASAKHVIAIFRTADQPLQLGVALMNQGNIYARLSHYDEALASYHEAHTILERLNSTQNLAMVEANQANVLSELDDFGMAQRMYQRARTRFAAAGMTSSVAQIDHNLACLAFSLGDYHSALTTFDQARRTFVAQDSAMDIAFVDLYRADIYLALNLWQEALTLAHQAREIFASSGMDWEVARLWLNAAVALAHLGEHQAAIDGLMQARALFVQEQNNIWRAVTELYLATFELRGHNLDAAHDWACRARVDFLQAGLGSRTAQCDTVLGEEALLRGEVESAKRYFEDALTHLARAELPAVSYECHYGLARVGQLQQRADNAAHYFRRAIDDIERLQATIGAEDYKIAFRSDKLQVYDAFIAACLESATEEALCEAFQTVERTKSRALLDALSRPATLLPDYRDVRDDNMRDDDKPGRSLGQLSQMPPLGFHTEPGADGSEQARLLAQLAQLKRELSWYYTRLHIPDPDSGPRSPEQSAHLSAEIGQREQQVSKLLDALRNPDLVDLPSAPIRTVSLTQIQHALPADTLLLEYYTIDQQFVVFGITRDTFWYQPLLVSTDEMTDLLEQFRFQLNKFGYGSAYRQRHGAALRRSVNACLERLYRALLDPLASRLHHETLIIVPHDVLHAAPFHAMFDGESYLIEKKIVSYAPSATAYHHLLVGKREPPNAPPLIVGIADETIPHAQAEAEALAGLFQTAALYVGEKATASVLLNNTSRPAFLHLSTHAVFRAENPLFSALKMADGWMNVNDIYNMRNAAPLVTLSACETGRNRVATGDELMGLCRGFFSAGAQSLVASLWSADDAATAELMSTFYLKLRTGVPVHQALRAAQLESLEKHHHPYFWAPFVLIGNPLYGMDSSLGM